MIESVIDAAREAGRIIQEVRAAGFEVLSKGDAGPVTEADRRADQLLRTRLLALRPAGWLSEETADSPERLTRDALWVVDPLDGTKEFVRGIPEYSVAIALVERGQPTLAVVHHPVSGDVYAAVRGAGTTYNGTRVRVAEGNVCLASRTEMQRGEFGPFVDWEITAIGSIAYKLALVAAGQAALTLSRGPKHEWDVCAGAFLVTEAGGTATDLFGGALTYNQAFPKTKGILAGAPAAYQRGLDLVRQTGASDRMDEFAGR
ncbi:MAG TPA: 3'(2'),5'-bisphosphate nucleotidase CysQ [Gemmatimonadales bacterium]